MPARSNLKECVRSYVTAARQEGVARDLTLSPAFFPVLAIYSSVPLPFVPDFEYSKRVEEWAFADETRDLPA